MSKKNQDNLKRILVIISGLFFLGVMTLPMSNLFQKKVEETPQNTKANDGITPEKLAEIAQGYEKVLQREPDNVTALQGLAEAKMRLKDYAGAKPPLEKLYQKFPNNPQLMLFLYVARSQTNDLPGATKIMENLVKLYPQEPKFKEELARLKGNKLLPSPTK
ncbi:MAG: hypothetical protein N5P05_002855 [Chroococcopsis gigantea SAG 12.99]|jgi:predicted Zn-dependent protease|nr:hypothetical protein [Chlorogloea purpurea SAG 13.99]MDV3001249.1 hypothetical protein [Chroococcopsis gigantea SAG 12.99]